MNKELQEIIKQFEQLESVSTRTVLATVVDVKGSSYRLPGARMLIGENGEIVGTVSGGCLEADVFERAQRVLQTDKAEVFTYDTTQTDSVFSLNMGCRGIVQILLEIPQKQLLDFFRSLYTLRSGGLVATLIESDSKSEIRAGKHLAINGENCVFSEFTPEMEEIIKRDCQTVFEEKKSSNVRNEFGNFFLEYIAPPVSLFVFGAGFDALPVADLAKNLGWRVTIVDHRTAFANRARFPLVDEIIHERAENLAGKISLDEHSVAIVMTHNFEHDKNILRFLLNSDAQYVGALGPKRRADNILQELTETGASFSTERLHKLYAPVGLDIGADTPESIALAIIAEIKSVISKRAGGFLRERRGSIYQRNAIAST